MNRLSTFSVAILLTVLCVPAFAYEGPQEQELDRSLAQMQAQDATPSSSDIVSTSVPDLKAKPAKPEHHYVGTNEQRIDQGLQPETPIDPADAAMVRKLNGGQ